MAKRKSFYEVVAEAVSDVVEHGFDTEERMEKWMELLRESAPFALPGEDKLQEWLKETLAKTYRDMVEKGRIATIHPGVSRYTLEKLRPQLRDELDKRIMASANLIKLNRKKAIDQTVQRFAGWMSSVPKGGTKSADKTKTKGDIRKALTSLPFEEKRMLIDQGHKLTASISEVIAADQHAIACIWHSNWRQPGYDYREDHKERDQQIYLIRNTRATKEGLVKPGPMGYYGDTTKAAEEPFCRCYVQWVYNLRDLPTEMLTAKGKAALAEAKAKVARADGDDRHVDDAAQISGAE